MKALITGGAGFIGSNLSSTLISMRWNVFIVDDLSSGNLEFVPQEADLFIKDFADKYILDKITNKEFDVVFHLAAMPRVSYSVQNPAITNNTNVNKTVLLLEACKGNIKRFVNTSSSAIYGNTNRLPTTENTVANPNSPYALQKSITEQYCTLFSNLYNLDTVSIRPFNVFGPNQKGDSPYACAVSAWLYAIKHNLPLRSDGTGEQTRDIIYVDDVVDIFIKAAICNQKFNGEVFNAGTGISYSNNEILEWFKRKFTNCKIINAPSRPGDVMHTLANMNKTINILGWNNTITFWDALEKTYKWSQSSQLF